MSGFSLSLTGSNAFFTIGSSGLNRFFFKESEISFCWSLAVPSRVFKTTFPVKPSVTNTSTFSDAKSLPSTLPIKFKVLEDNSL